MTHAVLAAPQHFREVDRIRVKGKNEPVTLYQTCAWRVAQMDAREHRALDLQAAALTRFRAQDWDGARALFTQAAPLAPHDKLPAIYLARIEHYALHPPGDDWDGVWTMDAK